VQQQIDSLSTAFNTVRADAAQSLVDAAVLDSRAEEFGVGVTDDEIDIEIATRVRLSERMNARLILVEALPDDAAPDAEATDEQREAAAEAAQAALDRVEGGEDFADVAADISDDFTSTTGGELGWFEDADVAYDDYFDALADADEGELIGPVETERGAAVLELIDRREATSEGPLLEILRGQGLDDEPYREFVRGELLVEAFRMQFADEIVVSPTAQRRVAQIVIAPVTGTVVPQERARHVLVQPDPDLESQAEATAEQWEAALEEAREVHELVTADDADWFEIAEEHSDDTGSGARGGDLGWIDPEESPFVAEFTTALAALDVGQVSEPIRTEFGYHVIQKTGVRESPEEQAAELVEQLRADPDSFAEVATLTSEDPETAKEGGELGWVAPYQLTRQQEDVIFALADVDDVSDPVDAATAGITIYQLLEVDDDREIEDERLAEIRESGFERWLSEEVRSGVDTWLDPQFQSSTGTT